MTSLLIWDFTLAFFVDTAPAAAAGVCWGIEWKPIAAGEPFSFAADTGTITDVCPVTPVTPDNDTVLMSCEGIIGGANLMEAGDLLMMRLYRDIAMQAIHCSRRKAG